ncbi:hypothetical protein H5410_017586 [Solanum commersonii]|uniref:Uncharacterized protein n=1 Tax=Solanum commersonii TaxID=4109 RepID=A0A9J6A0F7_SOLCO|nr:hypothetical protein H5410_017586 [Solanum commersonii]
MKSINIFRFLLVSLFPFVAFCRSFTSQNPIVLPTNNNNNDDDVAGPSSVGHGRPTTLATLVKNTLFIILSLEADPYIYLANECPNTVLQHVRETDAIDIMFSTVDISKFVVTGGTLGNESNYLFKIMKHEVQELENVYKIMYCPDICKHVSLTFHI